MRADNTRNGPRAFKSALLAACASIVLSACQTTNTSGDTASSHRGQVSTARASTTEGQAPGAMQPRSDVNTGYRTGTIIGLDINANPPTLETMLNMVAAPLPEGEDDGEASRLRIDAIRAEALRYGAQGGLAYMSKRINDMLQVRAQYLNSIYDFNRVMLRGPENSLILPPVISEATDPFETLEAGSAIRIADTVYEIVDQAKFAPVAPMWQSYLVRVFRNPDPPLNEVLPRTEFELQEWRRKVTEGWASGVQQARDIFRSDVRRMERDYTGMIRYRKLVVENKINEPIVAAGHMGVTGNSISMRINDRMIRIMVDPTLNLDASTWSSGVSDFNILESATPPSEQTAVPSEPRSGTRRY